MGTVGLDRVRANRVLLVIDSHKDRMFVNAAINSVNGARASYGFSCPKVIELDPPMNMTSIYTSSGRAAGTVKALEQPLNVLNDYRHKYDALAISSVIDVPQSYHTDYYLSKGEKVNPWRDDLT